MCNRPLAGLSCIWAFDLCSKVVQVTVPSRG